MELLHVLEKTNPALHLELLAFLKQERDKYLNVLLNKSAIEDMYEARGKVKMIEGWMKPPAIMPTAKVITHA